MNGVNSPFPLTPERMFYIMKSTMPGSPACFRDPHRSSRGKKLASSAPGLYSQCFTPSECELLDIFPAADGLSELNLLRVLLARTLAASRRWAGFDLKTHSALLWALGRTAANIGALF